MSAKPLGFYGLELGADIETAIDALPLHELTDLLDDTISFLNHRYYMCDADAPHILTKPLAIDDLADIDKIGLIRGLCDRLELELKLKLMEAAK
jgi:hypothetical protein